jgi:hypothetical protein
MNHAKHIATPAREVITGMQALGVWPEPTSVTPHPDGVVVTFPQGPDGGFRPRLIRNQRALDTAYRETRRYPSIRHTQVEISAGQEIAP